MKGGSSRRQGGPTASDLGSEEHSHAGQSQQPGTGTPRRRSRRIAARTDSPAWRVIILTGADGLRIGQYLAGHSCIGGRDEHADAVERQLRLLSPGVVRLLGKQRRVRVQQRQHEGRRQPDPAGPVVRSLLPAGGNLAGREPGRPAGRPGKTRRPKERYARLTDVKSCLDMHFRVVQSFNLQSINRPSEAAPRHGADACQKSFFACPAEVARVTNDRRCARAGCPAAPRLADFRAGPRQPPEARPPGPRRSRRR